MGQANLKYVELADKINRARIANYILINPDTGKTNPYELYRQEIIDKYFNGCYGEKSKEQLLDVFEEINKNIAYLIGI